MNDAAAALARLEEKIGHAFRDRSLLERALVHSSLVSADAESNNETLEFLGDAVVGLAVSEILMERHPGHDEGMLSRMRAARVSAPALSRAADTLELGEFLRIGKGEEVSGGRRKTSILAACYEAVIGAIFLDAGYETAREAVRRNLGDEPHDDSIVHAKTRLQELTQARFKTTPTYRTIDVSGPAHARRFRTVVEVSGEVMGEGEASNRKSAEQIAASEALARLRDAEPLRDA